MCEGTVLKGGATFDFWSNVALHSLVEWPSQCKQLRELVRSGAQVALLYEGGANFDWSQSLRPYTSSKVSSYLDKLPVLVYVHWTLLKSQPLTWSKVALHLTV